MKKIIPLLLTASVFTAFSSFSLAAMAPQTKLTSPPSFQEETRGNWLIRLRGIGIFPDESSDTISYSVPAISDAGKISDISDAYVPEIDFNYFFNPHVSTELVLTTARHSVKAKDIPLGLGKVDLGRVNLLPPTLTVLYHYLPQKIVDIYVGGGINYTHFYNPSIDDIIAKTSIDYDDTFGGVLQAGVDLHASSHWSFNADVKKIFIRPDVTVKVDSLPLRASTTARIDPWILGVGIGYTV